MRRLATREALGHVLRELEGSRLPLTGHGPEGSLDLSSAEARVHIKPKHTADGPTVLIIVYPDWSTARPTTGADTYQVTVPVKTWTTAGDDPRRTLLACLKLIRSAIEHLDAVAIADGASSGPCHDWATVHLARLHLGGMLPGWTTSSSELKLGAAYERFPAYAAMEDWIGWKTLFVDPFGRPIAPDVRNARAFRWKSLSVTAAPGRVHEIGFARIAAKTRISDLPDDPMQLARLVRTPGIPYLMSAGLAPRGWSA